MGEPDVLTTLDTERARVQHRLARLALPSLAISEWAELHGHNPQTAKGWALRGAFPPGAVWLSGRDWHIRPDEPAPQLKPGRKPK